MGLMASFERGMERFLVPVAIKLNSQKHVAAVRDGFVFTFPIIMASSLIILINFAILIACDGFITLGLLTVWEYHYHDKNVVAGNPAKDCFSDH